MVQKTTTYLIEFQIFKIGSMSLKYLQLNQYPSGTSLVDPQHVSGTSLCKDV